MPDQDRITLLIENLREARQRTLQLVADLDDIQMVGPRLAIVNPLRWEIGHVAWFEEYWLLRHVCGRPPIRSDGDTMYDSAKVAHDTRWGLRLPSKIETQAYMIRVLDDVLEQFQANRLVAQGRQKTAEYFLSLALFHEDMHDEAITYSRQTLSYPAPQLKAIDEIARRGAHNVAQNENRDVLIPGGSFELGNTTSEGFVFDNEQQLFIVMVQPFRMSRTATTNAEYAEFVYDNGYQRKELWSLEGWEWRKSTGAEHPVYWTIDGASRWRRNFDDLVPLEPNLPVLHVNWYEADAYCRWALRRLPTEAEWELAASTEQGSSLKRRFPWGNDPPTPHRANLDSRAMGCIDVNALPDGDSAYGCRQMIGNTWEWTSSDFVPYPGFVAGPYKEYSAPWFGNHKVLRGGCWVTRARLIHNTYRNFYTPDRRDVWAGFPDLQLDERLMRIEIVTPAPPGSSHGNRITAARWAGILKQLGHRVTISQSYSGKRIDLLVALHALRSYESIKTFHRDYPELPIVVALTGTDVYHALETNSKACKSLEIATKVVALQPKALERLQPHIRAKTRVIYQSVNSKAFESRESRGKERFDVCIVGHLRRVKDPFRAALAARLLPATSRVHVLQIGAAMTEAMGLRARSEAKRNHRYEWIGQASRSRTLEYLRRSRVCVISSLMEGGANVLSEAIVAGVPLLASRIDGNVGILGEDYPGLFEVGHTQELARLLVRSELDLDFLKELRSRIKQLAPLFRPIREQRAWAKFIRETKW